MRLDILDDLESTFGTRLMAARRGWEHRYTFAELLQIITLNAIVGKDDDGQVAFPLPPLDVTDETQPEYDSGPGFTQAEWEAAHADLLAHTVVASKPD